MVTATTLRTTRPRRRQPLNKRLENVQIDWSKFQVEPRPHGRPVKEFVVFTICAKCNIHEKLVRSCPVDAQDLKLLAIVVKYGNMKLAAESLEIPVSHVKHRLLRMRQLTDSSTTPHLVWKLFQWLDPLIGNLDPR